MTTPALFTDLPDPALVMNTETSALSHYTNFGFESLVQLPDGRVLAAGPAGLFLLGGNTDSGVPINASITTGFMEFKTAQTKRLESMYFGYTSGGQTSVRVEVAEPVPRQHTYLLETRPVGGPKTTRVRFGKGLFGRYWRLTFQNTAGSAFEVHDMSTDMAASARRI